MRVPDDLRSRVGMSEVTRSLRTGSFSKAHRLVTRYAARLSETFEMLRAENYTKERARSVIQLCFSDLAKQADGGFIPETDDPDYEIADQRSMADDYISELLASSQNRQFTTGFVSKAKSVLASYQVDTEGLPVTALHDLFDGYARALVEQQRLFKFRLEDRLSPHSPTDPLFASGNVALAGLLQVEATSDAPPIGPRLGELTDYYLDEKRSCWTSKTSKTNAAKIALLVEHFGPGRPVITITPQDIRGFRDAIRRLHIDYRHKSGTTFLSKQTDVEAKRIAPKTARLIFESTKAFFRWASGDAHLMGTNPAADIRVDTSGQPKKKSIRRRPFKAAELELLFSSPTFTGSLSVRRRFDPGNLVIRDAKFWIPILGYYTGARLGEIVQLHQPDVQLDGATPYIDVNEDGEGLHGERKHVKSEAGLRRIPLHPDVLKLGFGEFVRQRRQKKPKEPRLFYEVAYGADGQASTVFSKAFSRMLDKVGLTDPALVFHSFRHGAEDAFRNALTPQYLTDSIIGHTDGRVSSGYGLGTSLEVNADAVRKMQLPISIPAILGKHSANAVKIL